jgi:hypothetical protein
MRSAPCLKHQQIPVKFIFRIRCPPREQKVALYTGFRPLVISGLPHNATTRAEDAANCALMPGCRV